MGDESQVGWKWRYNALKGCEAACFYYLGVGGVERRL